MIAFNIDKTVTFKVEVEKGTKSRVWYMCNETGTRSMDELLGLERYKNVRAAVEFLLADPRVSSVATECGVTVARGAVKN